MVSVAAGLRPPGRQSRDYIHDLHRIAVTFSEVASAITMVSNDSRAVISTSLRRALAPMVEEVLPPGSKTRQEQEDAHQLLLRLLDVLDSALSARKPASRAADARRDSMEAEAKQRLQRAKMDHVPSYEPAVRTLCELAWERDMEQRSSILQRMMWGQYVKGIGCFKCYRWVEVRPEVYNMLELPIPTERRERSKQPVPLSQCLSLFFDQENSRNDHSNDLKCPGCLQSGEVSQKYALMRIPSHLVLVLKRYNFVFQNGGQCRISKATAAVEPPDVLDMREHIFNAGDNANSSGEDGGTKYQLGSICVHLGDTPRRGHYVALVKLKNCWWRVSDEKVRECTQSDWEEARRNCYILFYNQKQ
eukprot:TRINITY_DN43908_c0_g1_i2.p1 TRINITY_DN43908_c0_g1~~TRINITY_DN43908_c0_g1_i2.p1  ORF type:complete len:361 (+),score=84.71 TRINITY_DN43908_c0_g1_i2:215-1297(+)